MEFEALVEGLAVLTVFGLTLAFFSLVGSRTPGLLFNKKSAQEWQRTLQGSVGTYLTATSIFGTLTSLATVYVFFIGSSKLFGWWLLACCFSLVLGGWVSNALTRRIIAIPRARQVLSNEYQDGAVLASLFWGETAQSKTVVHLIKAISLIGMAGTVWLEFAVFGDVSGHLLGFGPPGKSLLVGLTAAAVFMFTFRYGLRGFVVADLLHSALIAAAVLMLIAGTAWLFLAASADDGAALLILGTPIADTKTCLIVVCNVFVVNAFWVVVSESHWLRMWLFEQKELRVQLPAQFATAAVWFLLIVTGWFANALTGSIGDDAIKGMLTLLSDEAYIFLAAFWVGAAAALFSTADVQSYCFRLVQTFSVRLGRIPEGTKAVTGGVLWPLLIGLSTGLIYFAVRYAHVPFDKLVFTIIPFSQNAIPAFLQLAFRVPVTVAPTIVALGSYLALAIWGFLQPPAAVAANLLAAIVPAIIGVGVVMWSKVSKR
jgi:hypothetical protein